MKGFSSTAQRQLRVPGHQLFALSRAQLERVLGADEGKRLYSHVLVQRNVSGVSAAPARPHGEGACASLHHVTDARVVMLMRDGTSTWSA